MTIGIITTMATGIDNIATITEETITTATHEIIRTIAITDRSCDTAAHLLSTLRRATLILDVGSL